jgi:hypothetical protein
MYACLAHSHVRGKRGLTPHLIRQAEAVEQGACHHKLVASEFLRQLGLLDRHDLILCVTLAGWSGEGFNIGERDVGVLAVEGFCQEVSMASYILRRLPTPINHDPAANIDFEPITVAAVVCVGGIVILLVISSLKIGPLLASCN